MIAAGRYVSYLSTLCVLALAIAAHADVELPPVLGDHMVLQRDRALPIWGRAAPGEQVTVVLAGSAAKAAADDSGRWRVELPPMEAGGPHTLTVTGSEGAPVTVNDVWIGEVWLCTGQSNMEWPVRAVTDARVEIPRADRPMIRQFTVPRTPSAQPREDVPGSWAVSTPRSVAGFSACGYFMAVRLQEELDVPIGLISSNWGGTRIEPWTPPEGFDRVPALRSIADLVARRSPDHPAYQKSAAELLAATERWLADARRALAAGETLPPAPRPPKDLVPQAGPQEPTMLYNGMLHGLVGLPIRGAIWYQGESNVGDGVLYADKMRALIEGWRELWGQGDFPFYFVQLAPFRYGNQEPHLLPEMWEAQAAVVRDIPNTGMVVINDIATIDNIHPPNKQDVGLRLANMALRRVHDRDDIVDSGPRVASFETKGHALRLTFENTAGGLAWRDGKPGPFFEIRSADTQWMIADAKIRGDTVTLSHKAVKQPCMARFAWHKLAEPNLVNGAGLPTGAFRVGSLPRPDALGEIDDAKGYVLALDLDLLRLGAAIRYDADHRASIDGAFDRIAYLVELELENGDPQHVWVSMDAFTDDLLKIGVPTLASGAHFAVNVANVNVESNVQSVPPGRGRNGVNLEFWPDNYGTANSTPVLGASDELYDFGDSPGPPGEGYGSMQIHDHIAKQTLFAVNHWSAGPGADIGIGTSSGRARDWTFAANAASYRVGRLRVFVRPE